MTKKECNNQQISENLKLANQSCSETMHIILFNLKYLLNYKVWKITKDSTLLLIVPNGKQKLMMLNLAVQ